MREAGPVGRRRGHAQKLRVSETCPDQDRPAARIADPVPASMTAHVVNVVLSGVFHASILFLVSAGLQVVFGVQKIFNLACGSFYALGAYGRVGVLGTTVPVYNLIVIGASLAIALLIGGLLTRTAFGRIIRASADNREMAEALGVDMRRLYATVFALGTALGTLGGALVIPATVAMSEMGIELIVEAFAVVVIGGLGSMRGALVGALVVGVLRSIAISVYPELEMLLIYLIVIAVLVLRPRGLFGGPRA